jgi:hypothetical protein
MITTAAATMEKKCLDLITPPYGGIDRPLGDKYSGRQSGRRLFAGFAPAECFMVAVLVQLFAGRRAPVSIAGPTMP